MIEPMTARDCVRATDALAGPEVGDLLPFVDYARKVCENAWSEMTLEERRKVCRLIRACAKDPLFLKVIAQHCDCIHATSRYVLHAVSAGELAEDIPF